MELSLNVSIMWGRVGGFIYFLLTDNYWNILDCNVFVSTLYIHRLMLTIQVWVYRWKGKLRQWFLNFIVSIFKWALNTFGIDLDFFVESHHFIQSFFGDLIVGDSEFFYLHCVLVFFFLFDVELSSSWDRFLFDFLYIVFCWAKARCIF